MIDYKNIQFIKNTTQNFLCFSENVSEYFDEIVTEYIGTKPNTSVKLISDRRSFGQLVAWTVRLHPVY